MPASCGHEGKIRAAINNADCVLRVAAEHGSFGEFVWAHAEPIGPPPVAMAPTTAGSEALAKELRRNGFRFVGGPHARRPVGRCWQV
jgi:DNA-3-methyladenine glycosylase I